VSTTTAPAGWRRVLATPWLAYPAIGAVLILAYYFVPPFAHAGWMYNIIGGSAVVAIIVGVRRNRPERSLPWYLFALGQALFVGGDILAYNYERFFHTALPFPSVADVLYLSVYPCVVAGLLLMVRHRSPGRDSASLIDSLIVSLGVGVLSWVFLMAPYAHDHTLTLLTKLISIAYPLMDLFVLVALIRLAVGAGARGVSYHLMVASVVALLATDAIYGWYLLHGGYTTGGWLDTGWALFYILWGTAALHPSMRTMSDPATDVDRPFSWVRFALLTAAVLVVPVVQVVQAVRGGTRDLVLMSTVSTVLFLLVVARMVGLVRRHQEAEGRERTLRGAGEAFVAAADREQIVRSAVEGIGALVGAHRGVELFLRADAAGGAGADAFVPVAVLPATCDPGGGTIARRPALVLVGAAAAAVHLPDPVVDALNGGTAFDLDPNERFGLLGHAPDARIVMAPLRSRDDVRGFAAVGISSWLATRLCDSVTALAGQAALALETQELAEDLHRRHSEARFRSLVQNSSDVMTITDRDGHVRYMSPSVQHVLGFDPDGLVDTSVLDLVDPTFRSRLATVLASPRRGEGDVESLELRMRHHDGTWLRVETVVTDLSDDPNVEGVVLNTRDITERKTFEEQLSHQAFHDSVTGLANRALFQNRVAHALQRCARTDAGVSVLFLDLDDFKTVNDSLGHAAGDQLLLEVGDRLGRCIRTADTAARLGGDEFAILLEDGGFEQAAEIAERVMDELGRPCHLQGKEVFVRASIGIAFADLFSDQRPDDLLRDADLAMYMAKSQGKGRYQVFEPVMHQTVLDRLELKADLQRAVDRQEFVLHYQPIFVLETGRISGVEALVRWRHPQRGLVPPDQFIPLAEESGLIVPLGDWVLAEACRRALDLEAYAAGDGSPLTMSVNLSAKQLQQPDLIDKVRTNLEDTGLDPERLSLEITESVMMADMEVSAVRLQQLKELGVQIALDDFGKGYSSLNYIRQFPVDILKVDKSFIDGVDQDGEVSALTGAIIDLASVLQIRPVAEGIEESEQLERLIELGCDLGQGFLFSRPLEPGALSEFIARRAAASTGDHRAGDHRAGAH
jgi:diguanylate cyclase (GGDEF)-like protein/PAS domain S-box-containing protein